MAKPPSTPPSRDRGSESEDRADAGGSAEQQDVSRRNSAGRPPQTKR